MESGQKSKVAYRKIDPWRSSRRLPSSPFRSILSPRSLDFLFGRGGDGTTR